ncbi:hypothetical protein EZV77_13685 [Burkholderia thailandensis]|nr:hypothetical protein CWD92_21910 [Burkholderia thailandensis]TBW62411.1 hypothetical protein EZV77_13685 [Burkholderia thailandensis]
MHAARRALAPFNARVERAHTASRTARVMRAAHRAVRTSIAPIRGATAIGSPPLSPPPRRLLIASRFITNRELLLCVLRARFV